MVSDPQGGAVALFPVHAGMNRRQSLSVTLWLAKPQDVCISRMSPALQMFRALKWVYLCVSGQVEGVFQRCARPK